MSKKNPLIGNLPADTMSNCAQVLSIVQLATESQKMCTSTDEVMGYYLIMKCVQQALMYEHDHHNEREHSLQEVS